MFSQCSDSHGALIYSLDQRGRGGDLIKRVVRDLEVLRESLAEDVRYRLLSSLNTAQQGLPKAL